MREEEIWVAEEAIYQFHSDKTRSEQFRSCMDVRVWKLMNFTVHAGSGDFDMESGWKI